MTYREKIQEMIKTIETIHEDAGWLRDKATTEEQRYWNDLRGIFYSAGAPLAKLDNSLSQQRANMEV